MKKCPKCGAINPKIKTKCNTHYSEVCKNIIGTKRNIIGIKVNVYCNSMNCFDEDDDWINMNKKKKEQPLNAFKAKDINNNIIDLFRVSTYSIKENIVNLHLHSGTIIPLEYNSNKKAKKMYKTFLKLEDEWNKATSYFNDYF